MYKRLIYLTCTALALTLFSVGTVSGYQVTGNFILSGATSDASSTIAGVTVANVGDTATGTTGGNITYDISGLDIIGDSTANDTAQITLLIASNSGDLNLKGGTGSNPGYFGIDGNGAGGISSTSEQITFEFVSGVATLGDGGTATVDFLGFNQARFDGLGADGENAVLGGTDMDGSIVSNTVFSNTSSFSVSSGANSVTGLDDGNFRTAYRARFRFQGTAVPEPSSALLLGVATLGLVLRRRR